VYSIIDYSRFKIIYGFNPLTHLDLFSLSIDEKVSLDNNKKKIHVVKALHENVRRKMQKKKKNNEKYVFKANKGQKLVIFKLDN
jgi:hypothetical protein